MTSGRNNETQNKKWKTNKSKTIEKESLCKRKPISVSTACVRV